MSRYPRYMRLSHLDDFEPVKINLTLLTYHLGGRKNPPKLQCFITWLNLHPSASSTMGVITDSHNSLHPFTNSMTKKVHQLPYSYATATG